MLISGLRGLRAAQQSAPIAAAAALSHVWRCLATEGGSGGGSSSGAGGSSGAGSSSGDAEGTEEAAAEHTIAIDRSGLIAPPMHSHDPVGAAAAAARKEPETELVRHLKTLIQARAQQSLGAAILVWLHTCCLGVHNTTEQAQRLRLAVVHPAPSGLPAVLQFRGGPLSLAEFMSEALTNPQHGYYTQAGCSRCCEGCVLFVWSLSAMLLRCALARPPLPLPPLQREVFGTAGDFVTSPEISQMMGEVGTHAAGLGCALFVFS